MMRNKMCLLCGQIRPFSDFTAPEGLERSTSGFCNPCITVIQDEIDDYHAERSAR